MNALMVAALNGQGCGVFTVSCDHVTLATGYARSNQDRMRAKSSALGSIEAGGVPPLNRIPRIRTRKGGDVSNCTVFFAAGGPINGLNGVVWNSPASFSSQ